jgi:nucleoside-diphosphate-sugar epimerase
MGQDLITDGSGFIGSHMCGLLLSHNYQERVLDSSQRGMGAKSRPEYFNSCVEHGPQPCFLMGRAS